MNTMKVGYMNQSPALHYTPVYFAEIPGLTDQQREDILSLLASGSNKIEIEPGEQACVEEYLKAGLVPLNPRHCMPAQLAAYRREVRDIVGTAIEPYVASDLLVKVQWLYEANILHRQLKTELPKDIQLVAMDEWLKEFAPAIPPLTVIACGQRLCYFVKAKDLKPTLELSRAIRYNLQVFYGELLNQQMREPELYSMAMDMLAREDAILVDMPGFCEDSAKQLPKIKSELSFELSTDAYKALAPIWDRAHERNEALTGYRVGSLQNGEWKFTCQYPFGGGELPSLSSNIGHSDEPVEAQIELCAMEMLNPVLDDYTSRIWEKISQAVIDDVLECTDGGADGFTKGDVALAIGRALAEPLGIEV